MEALKKKPKASIVRCMELMRNGEVDGVVSAGNTGAVVAASMLKLGLVSGVKRPGIAATMPRQDGCITIIDVGANINCRPNHLAQYALMASIYCREVLGISGPRVGLLNIGGEHSKGPEVIRETADILRKMSEINFAGHAEGQDIFRPVFDIVVCDGFVGNVILKLSEGLAHFLLRTFRKRFEVAEETTNGKMKRLWRKVYTHFKKKLARAFLQMRKKIDFEEYGGAPLLGAVSYTHLTLPTKA